MASPGLPHPQLRQTLGKYPEDGGWSRFSCRVERGPGPGLAPAGRLNDHSYGSGISELVPHSVLAGTASSIPRGGDCPHLAASIAFVCPLYL